jgi:prevent-host-death family protein
MQKSLKYIINKNGKPTSVIIPIKHWKKITKDYTKLENKTKLLSGLKEALTEVHQAKKAKKNLQSLQEFLSEL